MTLHIQLPSQVRARSFARPHSPAPSPKRNQRSTTAGLGGALKFHPLHLQRACTSQFRLLPHSLSPGSEAKYAPGLFRCPPDWCRKAIDLTYSGAKFTATLILAGKPCSVLGNDIQKLSLSVEYETGEFPLWGGFLYLTDTMSMYSGHTFMYHGHLIPVRCPRISISSS